MIKKVEHIGIAVKDINSSITLFSDGFQTLFSDSVSHQKSAWLVDILEQDGNSSSVSSEGINDAERIEVKVDIGLRHGGKATRIPRQRLQGPVTIKYLEAWELSKMQSIACS